MIQHDVPRLHQPPNACGPYALTQVLNYFGADLDPQDVLGQFFLISNIGTFCANIGEIAINLGFNAVLYPTDLNVFDPSWFDLGADQLAEKLSLRDEFVDDPLLEYVLPAYVKFLSKDGKIVFRPQSKELLLELLEKRPIIVGLSMTYLYSIPRNDPTDSNSPDVRGKPRGHYVTLSGYFPEDDSFEVTDPYHSIPFKTDGTYRVRSDRLMTAIALGQSTHISTVIDVFPTDGYAA